VIVAIFFAVVLYRIVTWACEKHMPRWVGLLLATLARACPKKADFCNTIRIVDAYRQGYLYKMLITIKLLPVGINPPPKRSAGQIASTRAKLLRKFRGP
jgi:hypothetical protein